MVGGGGGQIFILIHWMPLPVYEIFCQFSISLQIKYHLLSSFLMMIFFRKRMEDGAVEKAPMHEPNFEHEHKRGNVHEHKCEHEYVCEHESEHQRTVSSS